MEKEIMALVLSALVIAPVTTGIVEVIKNKSNIKGLSIILLAIILSMGLLGAVAYIFSYPVAESLLLGFLTGWASVGAFEGIEGTTDSFNGK